MVEVQDGPSAREGLAAQRPVRVDRVRVADRLQHRHVRGRVAVGVAACEVVPLGGGQLLDRLGLRRPVRVVLHLAREAAVVAHHHPGRHHAVGAQQFADRLDDLRPGGGDDHDVAARHVVLLDEGGRLVVDDRIDQVVQRLRDDLLDLPDVPAAAQGGEVLAHPLHLVVVGAAGREDELGICGPQDRPAVDQSSLIEGLAERECARLRNDRLVQVEEGRCAGQGVVFHGPEHRRPPFGVRWGAWVCLRGLSGTPWKSRIVRDRANPARLLPPRVGRGDDPRSPPRRGSSHVRMGFSVPSPAVRAALRARPGSSLCTHDPLRSVMGGLLVRSRE